MPRRKITIDVDARTESMSDEALLCRTLGHKWELKALSRKRILELLDEGQREFQRYCGNGCGCTWREVWSIREKVRVISERTYPPNNDYLMPAGSGRLRRGDAFAANLARELAGIV